MTKLIAVAALAVLLTVSYIETVEARGFSGGRSFSAPRAVSVSRPYVAPRPTPVAPKPATPTPAAAPAAAQTATSSSWLPVWMAVLIGSQASAAPAEKCDPKKTKECSK